VYVIGGKDANNDAVNTVYRLCLKTEKWATLTPMSTARIDFAAVVKDNIIYVFGGFNSDGIMSSTERYYIDFNLWEDLPDMPHKGHRHHVSGYCAISITGISEIYIVGGFTRSLDVFDTGPSLAWKNPTYLRDMPERRRDAAVLLLKNKYLVVIGGDDVQDRNTTSSCLIYDLWCNRWSSTPPPMDMSHGRYRHTAAVLDGKVVVAGGRDQDGFEDGNVLASVECIDAEALLEYAPLHFPPLPTLLFDRILEIGEFERELVPCTVFNKLNCS